MTQTLPTTTQHGLAERFLAGRRTKMILPYVAGKDVLDFGCGLGMWNLKAVRPHAKSAAGVDLVFANRPTFVTPEGIRIFAGLEHIPSESVDVVTSLACFEHIDPPDLPDVLRGLGRVIRPGGSIVGTFPGPKAKPVLEFLSYRLGIIDPSQIRDHRVYYKPQEFSEQCRAGGWNATTIDSFQFGFNTFFVLQRS